MSNFANKTKLLTVLVDSDSHEYILAEMRKAGMTGCTKLYAHPYEMDETDFSFPKCVLLTISDNPYKLINAISDAIAQSYDKIDAMALLFNAFNENITNSQQKLTSEDKLNEGIQVESKNKLIVTIVNRGQTEEIMYAARQAGATGGTIIDAKGTGTEEDAIFFGIRLAPEKEMLIILSDVSNYSQILDAIKNHPLFNVRGTGIIFTLDVEEAFFFIDKCNSNVK